MPLPRNPNAFANSPLDRAGHLRRDPAWLEHAQTAPETKFAAFHQRRPLLSEAGERLGAAWLSPAARATLAPDAATLFLGLGTDGVAHFAFETTTPDAFEALGAFTDLRAAGPRLAADDVSILGCAKAVFDWHARNAFCANCGAKSDIVEAGWKRQCPACDAEHFPRVDPVVIMLPVLGESCLLARQATWPTGMMSALAGYMEPGETVEEAVARETFEEAGLAVERVRLHSTQPWPFPSSLMIGAHAEVAADTLKIDPHEIETARWFTRDEARQLLARALPGFFCPPPFAIAHQLIKSWVAERD